MPSLSMFRAAVAFSVVVSGVGVAGTATAQVSGPLWDSCLNVESAVPDATALDACSTLIEQAPLSPREMATVLRSAGSARSGLGDDRAALVDYDAALEIEPTFVQALVGRGLVHFNLGDFDRAIADHSQAIAFDPEYAVAYGARGLARWRQNDLDGAIADYSEAIRLAPTVSRFHVSRGDIHAQRNDLRAAVADYDAALQEFPGDAETHYWRGVLNGRLGDFVLALADMDAAVIIEPGRPDYHAARGWAQFTLERYNDAKQSFDRAAQLQPDNPEHHMMRCFMRAVQRPVGNDQIDAEIAATTTAACATALQLAPDNAQALAVNGLHHLRAGRLGAALSAYDAAVAAGPTDAGPRYGRGVTRMRLGQATAGQSDIVAALQLDPKIVETYAKWGVTL